VLNLQSYLQELDGDTQRWRNRHGNRDTVDQIHKPKRAQDLQGAIGVGLAQMCFLIAILIGIVAFGWLIAG
jgi:hypothetical protein